MPEFVHAGLRLFYRQSGSAAPLLILPGNTASSALHSGEIAHFAARYHVGALDLPGTGQSERIDLWPDDWFALGAGAAAALIERLDSGPAIVVGCSGGGIVALLLAAARPDLVRAAVVDSCLGRLDPPTLRAEIVARARRTPEQVAFWRQANGDDWSDVVDADNDFLRRLADRGGDVVGDALERITCPVLLTGSLADDLLPGLGAGCLGMLATLTTGRAYLSTDGSHPLMWSRPAEFRAAVDAFLGATVGAPR
jgi:valacyclovir hydrolase